MQESFCASIIICHHTGDLLKRCLESLRRQSCASKVLVVSTERREEIERLYPEVLWLYCASGPARKRNLAASLCETKYLIFLDDDVELDPKTIENLIMEMEAHPLCAMGFAKILNMEDRVTLDDAGSFLTPFGFLWARAEHHQKDDGRFDERCEILSSKSATCIVRRDLFQRVEGFDEVFYILGEETDLSLRFWRGGWKVMYFPKAISFHAFGTSLKPRSLYYTDERVFYRGSRNYLRMLIKNMPMKRLVGMLPIQYVVWLFCALVFFLKGKGSITRLILKGVLSSFPTLLLRAFPFRYVHPYRMDFFRNPPLHYYFNRFRRYVTQKLHG